MNTEFKNLIPGKLYQVLDVEGGEILLAPMSSAEEYDAFEAPKGSIVMFISVDPPYKTNPYYKITFMYKSFVGYFTFGYKSVWYNELLTYEQYNP